MNNENDEEMIEEMIEDDTIDTIDTIDSVDSIDLVDLVDSKSVNITRNFITKYEFATIIGTRAQQLSENAPPYIHLNNLNDPIQIAIEEYNQGKLPLKIIRGSEIRTLKTLINPHLFP